MLSPVLTPLLVPPVPHPCLPSFSVPPSKSSSSTLCTTPPAKLLHPSLPFLFPDVTISSSYVHSRWAELPISRPLSFILSSSSTLHPSTFLSFHFLFVCYEHALGHPPCACIHFKHTRTTRTRWIPCRCNTKRYT